MPNSPLPDARALEEGILEDELPSRLSRVQDNVRNLLRNSRLGAASISTAPLGAPLEPQPAPATAHASQPQFDKNDFSTTPHSPTASQLADIHPPPRSSSTDADETDDVPIASEYRDRVQQMAHQSSLFNIRAVAALNHPDLTDPSLEAHLRQQKAEHRQRNAWKRSKHGSKQGRHGRGRKRTVAVELGRSQGMMCVFAALMLSATVATYIVLATTSNNVTPTFHILFILGIILATIVFAHSLMRFVLFNNRFQRTARKVVVVSSSRHRHPRHRYNDGGHGHDHHVLPTVVLDTQPSYLPPTPIPVHVAADEVRPDSREAEPTATVEIESQGHGDWDKEVNDLPNPPPAYGRWRGSVRANPDLLHWSPVVAATPGLPSPTYEEATAEEAAADGMTRPPSYVTRDSPARRRADAGPGNVSPHDENNAVETHMDGSRPDPEDLRARVDDDVAGPEMFEVRGIGFAV